MSALTLRPMSPEEQAGYRDHVEADYAAHQVEFGGLPAEQAHERARASTAELWPNGEPALGHHLFTAEVDGKVVGRLWLAEEAASPAVPGQAWIYDVEVDESARGNGYGRQLMTLALERARELGCTSLGLNVHGGNDVAIRLYQSMGFRTRAMQLSLSL